jgi:flagellar export protein FliJ
MKKFRFRLDPLLMLRRKERDRCRQSLSEAMQQDADLVAQRVQTEFDRQRQIDELRVLGSRERELDVDASAARRHYAVQLAGNLGEIEARRTALVREIELRRQALVRADQAVQALEKLAERQQADFLYLQERLEARELEETWQAIHAGERSA